MRVVAVLAAMWVPWQIGLAQAMLSPVQGRMSLQTGVVQPEPETQVNSVVRSQASQRFLRGRISAGGTAGAGGLAAARAEHASMVRAQGAQPPISALTATWQPVGPGQVASVAYGKISGGISSIAIDPADRTGNTVYLGTTGGGVWKSTNAAGPAESVTFAPMTDNLPVFSGSVGSSATASLSIGAISVQAGGIVLAGTGDPNDALDSYYGSGVLRSADSGLTWTLAPNSLDGASGRHYFAGLGFAGFAWSTVNPNLVVAAVSESAEGRVVHASMTDSVMGLYVSGDAGATWQMATISDGPQITNTDAVRSEPGWNGRDRCGVEPQTAAVLRGGTVPRLLRVHRWDSLDTVGNTARYGYDIEGVSSGTWNQRQLSLSSVSRHNCGAAGYGRYVCPDDGSEQC